MLPNIVYIYIYMSGEIVFGKKYASFISYNKHVCINLVLNYINIEYIL